MAENIDDMRFEEALKALEDVVAALEKGDLPLEESLALFEKGQQFADRCNELLEKASLKIEQLTSDGEIVEMTMDDFEN